MAREDTEDVAQKDTEDVTREDTENVALEDTIDVAREGTMDMGQGETAGARAAAAEAVAVTGTQSSTPLTEISDLFKVHQTRVKSSLIVILLIF